jgi:hypothetical protein
MANELLGATVFNQQVQNFTFRKIFELVPKNYLMEKVSEIKTKNQLNALLASSSQDPLGVSVLVGTNELREVCIEAFKLYKTQLYKKHSGEEAALIKSLLVNTNLPISIVKKLGNYHIENIFDLVMFTNEEILRNVIGLHRVEINEILYFSEEHNYEMQAPESLNEFDAYIEDLNLSTRTKKRLVAEGLVTISDLVKLSESDLRNVPGLGGKSVEEIAMLLKINNLTLCKNPR